jgi:hypothetical protein
MELVGIDEEVKQQFYKLASISLCPNLVRLPPSKSPNGIHTFITL